MLQSAASDRSCSIGTLFKAPFVPARVISGPSLCVHVCVCLCCVCFLIVPVKRVKWGAQGGGLKIEGGGELIDSLRYLLICLCKCVCVCVCFVCI
jgi:hypothetical protein